ncbi:MAG: hypothetical protein DRP62_03660 [Planctomycetota bacterium]|nr:MAG: hypothetical protein DRP62_03660 [Planctomycetota bacterium]
MCRKLFLLVSLVLMLALALPTQANLLTNGDFNTALGAEWGIWGDMGWVNQEVITPAPGLEGVYDGTLQMSIGDGDGNGSRGMYQVVAGTAGVEYTLDIQGGAQDWWWPNGKAYLKFLDSCGGELGSYEIDITADFTDWDMGVPYQDFSISATAPSGTTQVKVDLIEWAGSGTVWFDNAVLTPEPATIAILGLGAMFLRRKR